MENTTFELNTPQVAAELLEAEALVIDFQNGLYFSLRGSAAAIWLLVTAHHSSVGIVQQLETQLEDAAVLVPAFIQQLLQQQLIRPTQLEPIEVDLSVFPTPWKTPQLEQFDDMQALLLLDPIHEVEPNAGWPFKN